MQKRFVTIWFRYLKTDWITLRRKELAGLPLVLTQMDHGRKLVVAANAHAVTQGIHPGMTAADARALVRGLEVWDDDPATTAKLLQRLANWCIRYTPIVIPDGEDSLILDATGCTHLWGSEEKYLKDIMSRLQGFGFQLRACIADTIGAAWAITHFSKAQLIVPEGEQMSALLPLPPAALRLDPYTCGQLHKLGLRQVKDFVGIPRASLQRRFGEDCIRKISYALGHEQELHTPIVVPEPWSERLPCLEPILTLTGIGMALQKLLETLCKRLREQGKGFRVAVLKGYRIDGKVVSVTIGTNQATHNETHLNKLFSLKFDGFEPAEGIELFVLEAPKVEDIIVPQSQLWNGAAGLADKGLTELLDRLTMRFGEGHFHRYLPRESHWPEQSVQHAARLTEKPATAWTTERPRPLQLLPVPEPIQVTAPVPDYPPMNFRHKGKLHTVTKADGPERIEQQWWLQSGEHRDYYCIEDQDGNRFWVFRSGHYQSHKKAAWYLHGYFA